MEIERQNLGSEGYYGFQPEVVANLDQATLELDSTLKQPSARAVADVAIAAGK